MSNFALLQQDIIETRKRLSVMAKETLTVQMVGNAIVKYTAREPKGLWQKILNLLGIQASFDLREFEAVLKKEEEAVQAALNQAQVNAKVQVAKTMPNLILAK